MWDLIASVPDHCLSFYFLYGFPMSNSKQLYTIIFIFSNDVLKLKFLNS